MIRNVVILLLLSAAVGLTTGMIFGVPQMDGEDQGVVCTVPDPGLPQISWISQVDAELLIDDPTVRFVDARTPNDYQQGHVAGAVHIADVQAPFPEPTLARLRDASTVITYCDTTDGCALSTRLASRLVQEGLSDVRVLEGGIDDWIDHGFRAESGSCGDCQ